MLQLSAAAIPRPILMKVSYASMNMWIAVYNLVHIFDAWSCLKHKIAFSCIALFNFIYWIVEGWRCSNIWESFLRKLFEWPDQLWMRCQQLALSLELLPLFVIPFQEIPILNFPQKLEGITCIYHMLVRGHLGALHTWRSKDSTMQLVSP